MNGEKDNVRVSILQVAFSFLKFFTTLNCAFGPLLDRGWERLRCLRRMEDLPSIDTDDVLAKEKGGEMPRRMRVFDDKMKSLCWQKADVVPGRHPERWRKDVAGNIVCRRLTRCEGCLCHEYDHIQPYSKGGETDVRNCQILQSRVNRLKGNKNSGQNSLKDFSCDLRFTDKELDVIEMAVYGNVERPGMQCRCKSVAENLGSALYKVRGPQTSCELPYKDYH